MAIRNISNIYNFYQYVLRKERGIFCTPQQFGANMDAGQMDAFEDYFKQYGIDQTIHDALRPFRTEYQWFSASDGTVPYPTDYLHAVGTPYVVNGSTLIELTFVNEDEFVSAYNSQLRPISYEHPIARDTADGFRIFPNQIYGGFLTYLRRPNTPVYGYVQVGRAITYNSGSSVQLQWSDAYINNIIARALVYSGVNMDEKGIEEFAERYKNETQ